MLIIKKEGMSGVSRHSKTKGCLRICIKQPGHFIKTKKGL